LGSLAGDIDEHPYKLLRERAAKFGVRVNAIWYAEQRMKKSKKKRSDVTREC
jgi:transposase